MKKVIVMSGVSGSGKSTYAEKILNETQGVKVSADHFFMKDGVYAFDVAKLGAAHADCFRRFINFINETHFTTCDTKENVVVVDNTNCTEAEISPYMLASAAFGWEAEIITLVPKKSLATPSEYFKMCNQRTEYFKMCAQRNAHGVSLNVIENQWYRLSHRGLPPYWKNTFVESDK
jgi:hypothetical protein